jgi:hypothetical protein
MSRRVRPIEIPHGKRHPLWGIFSGSGALPGRVHPLSEVICASQLRGSLPPTNDRARSEGRTLRLEGGEPCGEGGGESPPARAERLAWASTEYVDFDGSNQRSSPGQELQRSPATFGVCDVKEHDSSSQLTARKRWRSPLGSFARSVGRVALQDILRRNKLHYGT